MRGFAVILVVVVLGAAALSIMILPSQQELGTMYLRDQKYEESLALFERQVAEGDLSSQTVSALLAIYLQYGDVERAIELTRKFGRTIGERPDILARLADLYAADRRTGLYRQTMEKLVAIQPTKERLEQLADAHYHAADPYSRARTLKRLISLDLASPERILEYADLAVSLAQLDEALEAYLRAAQSFPAALDWSYRLQIVELLLNAGRLAEAAALTTQWLDGSEPLLFQISFAQLWVDAGQPARAIRILNGRPTLQQATEPWRAIYVLALRRSGREQDAYSLLRRWLGQGLITPSLSADLIDLAVANRDIDTAVAVLDHLNATELPTGSVLLLVSSLHQAGRDAEVDRLVEQLGPERMAQVPVLAAEVALARGDTEAANRWADAAIADTATSVGDQLALANVLVKIGREPEALDMLRVIATDPEAPTEALTLLGELYGRGPDPEAGYWEINALLAQHYTLQLRAVWAELALATGRVEEVQEWVARTSGIEPRTLESLFFMAERRESWGVAITTARRLVQQRPTDLARERLANALFRGGQAAEALSIVEAIPDRSDSGDSLYIEILQSLGLTDRLAAIWEQQIGRPDLTPARRRELVYNLLEAGAEAAAWPHILALANAEGGAWWFALADAAVTLGRGNEAADAIADAISRFPADNEQVPSLVAALESAEPSRSPDVLRVLADRAPALWADTYAYTLRNRGRIEELNQWLAANLATATDPAEALVLAQRLAETAPPLDTARAIRSRAELGRQWAELYVELLRKGGRAKEATSFLIALAERGRLDPTWQREIAFQMLEAGDRAVAERLFRATAANESPDGPSVQQLFYIWGPRPEPSALDWIEGRASAAKGADRLAWLERLLAVRAGERVLKALGDVSTVSSPAEVELLVKAQAQGQNPQKLRDTVSVAIDRIKDVDALERLARTAETTRDRPLIISAWKAVRSVAPSHSTANRELGLIAYDESRLIDAERYLGAFLANGPGDFEANYFYGEVLLRTNRKDQAGPFYQRAYDQLTATENRDFYLDVSRANILRRLGRRDEAARLMAELLENRPDDRALRADFADLLIEMGNFERARYVLRLR
ncbi:tetratricopeptide repeat protein [Thalassobaculum sp.]|uniref:tetratricopeptide repeat protein n=1 Tax=Thalassobaculum sp. TaxID=2022740 RepID=UPI0032EE3497